MRLQTWDETNTFREDEATSAIEPALAVPSDHGGQEMASGMGRGFRFLKGARDNSFQGGDLRNVDDHDRTARGHFVLGARDSGVMATQGCQDLQTVAELAINRAIWGMPAIGNPTYSSCAADRMVGGSVMIWKSSFRLLSVAASLVLAAASLGAEQSSEIDAVAAANIAFDKASSELDIGAMESLWESEPHVITVDRAGKRLAVGWEANREYWEKLFEAYSEISQSTREPQIHVNEGVAWVVGVQTLKGKLKNGNQLTSVSFSTNIYEKRDGRWLIALHTASPLADQVRDGRRGLLGAQIQPLDASMAQTLGLGEPRGALVVGVNDASAAKLAGIRKGDVIVKFNGSEVKAYGDLPPMVAATLPGKAVEIVVFRDREEVTLPVILGEQKDAPQ
jgi:ketosteroid isomerase-like protein